MVVFSHYRNIFQGAIFSICCMSDGKILSGGGKDRKIIEWNQSLEKTGTEIEVILFARIISGAYTYADLFKTI